VKKRLLPAACLLLRPLLLQLVVIVLAARAGAVVARWLRQPSVVGEIVAGLMPPKNGIAYSDTEKANVLALSKLVAGATSAYAGGNAQTAITTAETAVQNNALVPALVGLAWLADKAWTAYEVSQDIAAIRDGTKTVEQVAKEKGTDYVVNVIAGNVARYGVKVVQHVIKKDGVDVVAGVSQTRLSPAQLQHMLPPVQIRRYSLARWRF
jgi:hypothetical protein